MSVNTMRFRVRKAAGSPSVKGAGGIETLASHACNPCAHPDYIRKGSLPQGFDRTEHLAAKLDHCVNYLRRAEVISSKLDYERTKTMNLTDSANNYAASKGTLRYVVTSYVLNQVLTDLGLTDTNAFFRKSNIVNMSSVPPVIGLADYVPGYDLFKALNEQVASHQHDVSAITGALKINDFTRTTDSKFRSGVEYYEYNTTTHEMNLATVTVGAAITGNYYRKVSDQFDRDFTYTIATTGKAAGTVVDTTIPDTDIFDVSNVSLCVDYIGMKDGVKYVFTNPTVSVTIGGSATLVSANSLVSIEQTSTARKLHYLIPNSFAAVFPSSATPNISDMDSYTARVTVKKIGIA